MQTTVMYEQDGDVATLTFTCDEPGKPTTLDFKVLESLDAHLATIESQPLDNIRAVIVRSAFPKYFVVGANIEVLKTLDEVTIEGWVRLGHRVLNRMAALPMPVLALVEGYALGGGLELAMACDLILATDTAKLGQPEARLGMVSGWGGSARLPRRVSLPRAKELFFTGRIVDAASARAMGLVDFVGDGEAIDAYLESFLTDLRACSPLAVTQQKRLLDRGSRTSMADNCGDEVWASQVILADAATKARVADYLASRKRK